MMPGNGQLTVPPGFRFHPTDEELLYYYLRKKVSYEAIDLDVIREVDLNKLEPWDLKDKCRIGSGPQNEWYFFSHKDKKYPTGTRTNRATMAGFWKATGRDKVIHLSNSKRIGMRKTLVFYTGRAPHGQKTDWIMHEYRLDDNDSQVQEDGWVVCRVFKKIQTRGFQADIDHDQEEQAFAPHCKNSGSSSQQNHLQGLYDYNNTFESSMHLPQLFSPESAVAPPPQQPSFVSSLSLNSMDLECSHSLLRLTSGGSAAGLLQPPAERFHSDWSFLDKLLASHGGAPIDHQTKFSPSLFHFHHVGDAATGAGAVAHHQKFPFQYLGCQPDLLKFSK